MSLAGSESPVIDGDCGYVSEDVGYLNRRLGELLADRELARALGRKARERALAIFPMSEFVAGWRAALELAVSTFERAGVR